MVRFITNLRFWALFGMLAWLGTVTLLIANQA